MKRWEGWVLGTLLLVGATSAFAEGGCQSGFTPRMYPFYDRAGQYIGTRAMCAPIPCAPGYQDSTCAVPLRNGAIPQPQCQNGPGWTTVAASVWQGARWSDPQCSYQARPSCPPGYDEVAAPNWDGWNWVGQQCQPTAPPARQLVQATAVFQLAPCNLIFAPTDFRGSIQVTINKKVYSDGSVEYYQYQRGFPNLETRIDEKGRFYNVKYGNTWDLDPSQIDGLRVLPPLNGNLGQDPDIPRVPVPNVPGAGSPSTCGKQGGR